MARTVEEIKKQMTDMFISNETIRTAYQLQAGKSFEDEFSKASIESILFYCVAFSIWFLEKIFATLTADTNTYIANMKPHTLLWYANKAKLYQHGRDLVMDEDYYDNDGVSDEVLKNERIVKHAAVVEAANQYGRLFLRIKLAGEQDDELIPLSVAQVNGLKEYFKTIKDAGVMINVESYNPDKIRMSWKIFYDPLIIDAEGNRLDGTMNDVGRVAVKDYLKKLPFNGVYALQKHEDHVQAYPGIVLCPIQYAQTKWGGFDWENVNVKIVPDAGYLRFENDEDLTIEYIAQSEI